MRKMREEEKGEAVALEGEEYEESRGRGHCHCLGEKRREMKNFKLVRIV